jgi:hypothetical protein
VQWYLGCIAIIGGLIGYSIWTEAWTFTGLIVLIVGIYVWQHRRDMPNHSITITDRGFQYDAIFTPWQQCKGFWMLRGPDYIELHLEREHAPTKECRIQLGSLNPEDVHDVLAQYVSEQTHRTEDTLDMITRILKI